MSSPSKTTTKPRIKWYRCPVKREDLSRLNKRSDLKGFAQTLGFFGLLAILSSSAIYASFHAPWYVTALLVYLNGMVWHFLINGIHELVHDSVFKTRWLNRFFLILFSFLHWFPYQHFWASHTEHHKYTLYPPDDSEIVLPQTHTRASVLRTTIINLKAPYDRLKSNLAIALGHIPSDPWTQTLFPESDVDGRKKFIRWARILLVGHSLIVIASLIAGWWIVLLVITFPVMFGQWLQFLCNTSQHIGLRDNVPDYRLCCRTIYLNPIVQFLYWHMNYHTEHHMYAAVPCYNLGKLHRLIKHDMQPCPHGLYQTWKQIGEILERQKIDPNYQYEPPLPSPSPAIAPRNAPPSTPDIATLQPGNPSSNPSPT